MSSTNLGWMGQKVADHSVRVLAAHLSLHLRTKLVPPRSFLDGWKMKGFFGLDQYFWTHGSFQLKFQN